VAKQKHTGKPKEAIRHEHNSKSRGEALDYSEGWSYVNLRIPLSIVNEIDHHLLTYEPKTSRMHWIIKATLEKLERDK